MTPAERKAAFRAKADEDGKTLGAIAYEVCGVSWMHLSTAIANPERRRLSDDVKQKFAAYIGRTVDDVFGGASEMDRAS